jgi:hypothetical protein
MSASPRTIVAAALVALSTAVLAQQVPVRDASVPAMAGNGLLAGTVVNDLNGRPLRRASVSISGVESGLRVTAVTDDTGSFSFADLPADRYSVTASKPGFVNFTYGAKRPGRPGATLALAGAEQKKDLTLKLQPGGVLTGTIRDSAGEPMPGARVVVLRSSFGFDTGERTLTVAAGGLGSVSDDRGVYRLYGLPPDDYFVVVTAGELIRSEIEMRETTASEVDWADRLLHAPAGSPMTTSAAPEQGRAIDYAPVFFPGVYREDEATLISLKEGEERSGLDVSVRWTPTARISGNVVSPDGVLPSNMQVTIMAHDTIPGVPFSGFGHAQAAADGTFSSAGLLPGDYTVAVRPAPDARSGPLTPAMSALFGVAVVAVNGTDTTTTITLQSGVTVSGRLVFDGDSIKPPADLTKVRVALNAVRTKAPTLVTTPSVNADASGAFTFTGVTPGRYRIIGTASGGWQFRSANAQGRDSADFPLEVAGSDVRDVEVAFTDRPTEISGDLLDAAGHPASDYVIIVFPADKSFWGPQSRRTVSTRPASDGHFRIPNLPPGEYLIAAVNDVEQGQWFDPSFLAQLEPAARRVTLADGEKKVQSFKIGGEHGDRVFRR